MEFTWANDHHRLVGVENNRIQATSHKELSKHLRLGDTLPSEKETTVHENPDVQCLISTFADLFTKPSGLPP